MKRQIFIGDIQGCYGALCRLLDRLKFDPAADKLRLAGDLVNRGGESLETLRFLAGLGDCVTAVLGNHDLHLLAYAHHQPRGRKRNREFDVLIDAPDGQALLDWLIARPLMWKSKASRLAMVHAGVDPRWGPKAARERAREVEKALAEEPEHYFAHMYGDRPRRWKPSQPHFSRLRSITNVFTRMRFCDSHGRLDLLAKSGPRNPPAGFRPWFDYLHPDWRDWTLVFGHWSMLGLFQNPTVLCLDTGCVWGGSLSALVIEPDGERRIVAVDCHDCRA